MTTCPSCGIAGDNLGCPNHSYWGINPLPDSIPMPEQSAWASLYAEVGRLNVLLNEKDKEIEWLRGERPAVVAWLRLPSEHPDPTRIITMRADEWARRVNADADFIESGGHRKEGTE